MSGVAVDVLSLHLTEDTVSDERRHGSAVDTRGGFLVTRAVVPRMLAAGGL